MLLTGAKDWITRERFETMENQWPPAPMSARRVEMYGRMEIHYDGDMIEVAKPAAVQAGRKAIWVNLAVSVVAVSIGGYSMVTKPQFPWSIYWPQLLVLLSPLVLMIPATFFLSRWLWVRTWHTTSFSIRRSPREFLTHRKRAYVLPETARFEITKARYMHRRFQVLWLTIPANAGARKRRFGLGAFKLAGDAENAKQAIADFLGANP